MPLAATTTKLHITSNATNSTNSAAKNGKEYKNQIGPFREQEIQSGFKMALKAEKSEDAIPKNTSKNRDTRPESKNQVSEVPKIANESASWLNWFSKSEIATDDETSIAQPDGDTSSASKNRSKSSISEALQDAPTSPKQRRNSEPSPISPNVLQEEAPRSWLSLWGNTSTQTKSSSSASAIGIASNPQTDSSGTGSQTGKVDDAKPGAVSTSQPPQQPIDSIKSSYGWAFWSRSQPKSDDEKTRPGSVVGELALAGSSSQSKLESAVVDEARGVPNKVSKRQRPQSLEGAEDPKRPRASGNGAKNDSIPEAVPLAPEIKPKVDAGSKAKRIPDNLLLPSFRNTYRSVGRPSLIQQISSLLQLSSPSEPTHVDIVQNPPRVRRALAIVSLARSLSMDLTHVANLFSIGCSWLFPGTVDSFSPGPTNRHIYSFCQ